MWKFFSKLDLRVAIKTGIAAGCSFFVAKEYSHFFARPDMFISGLWCVVTTIVVMQANIGSTYKAGAIRFIGVVIGSLAGAFATEYFGATILALGISVASAIIICSLLGLKDAYRIAALSVAIVMLSWSVHPDSNPWVIGFFRSLDSTVGIIIAIVIAHLVWPDQTWTTIRNQFFKSLQVAKNCFHTAVKIPAPQVYGRELSELFSLLSGLNGELHDSRLDFFVFVEDREKWFLALQGLDRLSEAIAVVQGIPKTNLVNMFDESLNSHVEKFIEEALSVFEELQSLCLGSETTRVEDRLQAQEQALSADMERFRDTHATRNFNLEDLENFYSFFYHLHFIAQQLYTISKQLQNSKLN